MESIVIVNSENIQKVKSVYDHKYGARMKYLYDYYLKSKNTPIEKRESYSSVKAETHTNNHIDFFGDIVKRKVGYMGQKIEVSFPKEGVSKSVISELENFNKTNNMNVKNPDTVKLSTVQGRSDRLMYTDNGELKVVNIPGNQVVYEYGVDIFNPDRAYYYYSVENVLGETCYYCNVYDKTMVYYWEKANAVDANGSTKGLSWTKSGRGPSGETEQEHNFTEVPLIPFMNNEEMLSDCENTEPLMNTYDEIISDTAGEVKAMRLAYLILSGDIYTGVDKNGEPIPLNKWLTETGVINFASSDDGKALGSAEMLEKQINDQVIENILNRYREHIYELSGSVDLKKITEGSNQRVFTVKVDLMPLETTATTTEGQMVASLRKQYRLWSYWLQETKGISVNSLDIQFNFTRVFPADISAQADTLAKLANQMPFIDALKISGITDDYIGIANRQHEEEVRDQAIINALNRGSNV